MKAIILAGGKGKRFGWPHKLLPKPLVPLARIPMLHAVINDFADNPEVDEVIVLAGKNKQIRNSVNQTRFSKPVTVHNFDYGVFGDLLAIRSKIGNEPFLLGSADNLVLARMPTKRAFEKLGAWMVIAITKTQYPNELTGIDFKGEQVVGIHESKRQSQSGFGTIGKKMVSPKVLDFIVQTKLPQTSGIGLLTERLFQAGKKIVPIRVPREKVIHITRFSEWWRQSKRGDALYAAWLATRTRMPKRKPRTPSKRRK